MSAKRLGDLIGSSDALAELADTARRQSRVTADLLARLPADYRTKVIAAGLDEAGTLTLTTDSPVWATRLRYAASDVISHYADAGIAARQLVVKVRPAEE